MNKMIGAIIFILLFFITSCTAIPINPSPTMTPAPSPTMKPEISDANISSEIQNYYQNLTLKVDLSPLYGIVDLPINDEVTTTNIEVVDKAINGTQATIIARITFKVIDMPGEGGRGWNALRDYFGLDFTNVNFSQERKFLFQKYESGIWRLEQELEK